MKKNLQFLLALLLFTGCNIITQSKDIPEINTKPPTCISTFSVKSGGEIVTTGDGIILSKGLCWSIHTNPTISDSIQILSDTLSNYICKLTSLDSCTTYYIKSFASNEYGTGYGQEFSFTTLNNILAGSWKYTYEGSGDWHEITFNKNMTWISYASSIWDFSDSGTYTFDDEIFVLKTHIGNYYILDYRLIEDSLIIESRSYNRQ